MQERQPTRKLLYPAGLISLSFLSLLFFAYHQQHLLKAPLHALEVTYWDPDDPAIQSISYKDKNFTKLELTGGPDDKVKLDYAQIAMRELIHQADTTLVIEFTFKKQAKYSSLVKLLDLCQIEGVLSYVNFGDKFWIFNLGPQKPHSGNIFFCGSRLISCIPLKKTLHFSAITAQPIIASLSLALFILLICLSGRRIKFLHG